VAGDKSQRQLLVEHELLVLLAVSGGSPALDIPRQVMAEFIQHQANIPHDVEMPLPGQLGDFAAMFGI